ncbi:MAG: amidohydrolase family protein [Halobacteria archaeon]|nr:amidohydrolase family protein [Halobacteria archaeon]
MSLANAVSEVPEEAFDETIIDLDFHLNPTEEDLLKYVDDERAKDRLTTEFGMLPIKGKWDAAYAIKEGNEGLFTQGRAEIAEDVRKAAETIAVDTPVVTPGLNNAPNPVLKNVVAKAYNDYMLDNIVDEDIYCAMLLPQWDPEFAVEELERVGNEKRVLAAYGWFGPFNLWGDTKHDPIFEKLTELDMPLFLHGSLSFWPQQTPIGDNMLTWTEILGFDWPVHGMVNVVNMIMTGVFDDYPDLDVVFQEAGHWWVPFLRYRMDEFYEMHPEDVKVTPRKFDANDLYLEKKPSQYLVDNIYLCTQPMALPKNARQASMLLELSMAEDVFVYSSDWPHQTLDPPTWAFQSRAFDEELRSKILRENAQEILGI